jgi:hypothetical protein
VLWPGAVRAAGRRSVRSAIGLVIAPAPGWLMPEHTGLRRQWILLQPHSGFSRQAEDQGLRYRA